jgi:acyl-CoA dehydrogenase
MYSVSLLVSISSKSAPSVLISTNVNSADPVYEAQIGEGDNRWEHHPAIIEELKAKAKKLGLWNMFLPKGHYKESPGYTNLEYGLMAEWLGKSRTASEATNCAAPDTGNMEVLAKYGNDAQKAKWLKPLMDGEIRSAFLMTEPDVASSDARNIQLHMRKEGNEYVLNGSVSPPNPLHGQC